MQATEVGASVTIKKDVGYKPYIEYLKSLNGANPPFGTRQNSTLEISLWEKAVLDDGDDPLECCKSIASGLRATINGLMNTKPVSDAGNNGYDPEDTIEIVQYEIDGSPVGDDFE